MSTVFVVSDTHFSHSAILFYCGRPWLSKEDCDALRLARQDKTPPDPELKLRLDLATQEMDEAMVERWNRVVGKRDTVIHLGDVYFGSGHEHLGRLNGTKHLILGNHDHAKDPAIAEHFNKIEVWSKRDGLLLTHVPVHPMTFEFSGAGRNVHGHIHERHVLEMSPRQLDGVRDNRYLCVSVEHTDYAPIPWEEVKCRVGPA